MKRYLLTIICLATLGPLHAGEGGEKSQHRRTVSQLLKQLANADQYAYRYEVSSSFPDGTKGSITGRVFKSMSRRIIYTESNKDVDFKCTWGAFAVRYASKEVYWRPFEHDSDIHDAFAVMDDVTKGLYVLDSLFIRNAQLSSVSKTANETKLSFTYPAGALISTSDFVFDQRRNQLVSIHYDVVRITPYSSTGLAPDTIRQRVAMSGFSSAIPEYITPLIAAPLGERRLQTLYKNFSVKKI